MKLQNKEQLELFMLKRSLYIYAMVLFSCTSVQACEEDKVEEQVEIQARCRCPHRHKGQRIQSSDSTSSFSSAWEESSVFAKVDDDNEELEKATSCLTEESEEEGKKVTV